jgi:hypothetical protein
MNVGGMAMNAEQVSGQFARYTPTDWNLPYSGTQYGPCMVSDSTYTTGGKVPGTPEAYLDAGDITISGPNIASGTKLLKAPSSAGPAYILSLGENTLGNGGAYTLTGKGGTEVGSFTVNATMPTNFSVTNWDSISAIDRKALTVKWTGSGFDKLLILVGAQNSTGGSTHSVAIACIVQASLGTFSVPTAALARLPVVAAASDTSSAILQVSTAVDQGGTMTGNTSTAKTLTPNLVGGGKVDYGSFTPFSSVMKNVSIN